MGENISPEKLREKLLEDAKRKAEQIIKDAEKEAKKIIEEAEHKWREKAEKARMKIINEAKLEANKVISEARRQARLLISEAKAEVIREVVENARKKIIQREGFNVKKSLENLLDEALEYIDNPALIIVNENDLDIIREIAKAKSLKDVKVIGSNDIIGGLIVESQDGKKVDNSYDVRLQRARENLLNKIAYILWGKIQ